MSPPKHEALARDLSQAWADAVAIPAPSTTEPSLTMEDAYAIQELIVAKRMSEGRKRAGWKLGLTSAEPPATPIVGTLLSDMVRSSGSELDVAAMVTPMVEAELVIRIGETIEGVVTATDLQRGPHSIGPGLEIIDYRTVGSTGPIDWVADNSTVAYAVVGDFVPISSVDPPAIEASLSADGAHLATGRGSQVMGNPLEAVAWLSRHLVERGLRLDKGHVILTGSLTGHHTVPRDSDSRFAAEFGELGSVSVQFRP